MSSESRILCFTLAHAVEKKRQDSDANLPQTSPAMANTQLKSYFLPAASSIPTHKYTPRRYPSAPLADAEAEDSRKRKGAPPASRACEPFNFGIDRRLLH
jgi:hypothetical protein